MALNLKATVEQFTPTLLPEGDGYLKQTKLGQLFTAGWKQRLLLSGKVYSLTVGTLAAGADLTEIVGGGNGTVINADQPEAGIGVPAGYWLIPLYCHASAHSLSDAADDEVLMAFSADRTATVPTDGTKTAYTMLNSLDGGPAFPGTAFTACTADMTDPTTSEVLCSGSYQALGTAVSAYGLTMHYEPSIPRILAGPCAVYLSWGGTIATHGSGQIEVAVVPQSWFPIV